MTTRSNHMYADDTFGDQPVETLASQVLGMMMQPGRGEPDTSYVPLTYPELIDALGTSFRADDPDERRRMVADLLKAGLSSTDFILSHAGDTARLLGDLWAENEISFSETTIGVARIQETVRALAARRHSHVQVGGGAEILLAAPEAEDHLLGLFVACEAFELKGCYVHLAIGHTADEIAALAQKRRFNMIGISISSDRTVKEARGIVKKLRANTSRVAPIILGGGLALDQSRHRQLLEETGADHVTSDPTKALGFCNIEARHTLAVRA